MISLNLCHCLSFGDLLELSLTPLQTLHDTSIITIIIIIMLYMQSKLPRQKYEASLRYTYIIGPSFEIDNNGPYAKIMQFKSQFLYVPQVAFGDDFEDMQKYARLKYAKGNGSLLFLLTHALEGYGRVTYEPLLPVS